MVTRDLLVGAVFYSVIADWRYIAVSILGGFAAFFVSFCAIWPSGRAGICRIDNNTANQIGQRAVNDNAFTELKGFAKIFLYALGYPALAGASLRSASTSRGSEPIFSSPLGVRGHSDSGRSQ